ncbi:MAG: hypothetical protein ACHQIL_03000 [Steroidobacterales bacterium]
MSDVEHLLKSYDIESLLDEIASADPPAYLHRCFAEGIAAALLSWSRLQQLAACAMVVDAVAGQHDYAAFEHELIADWRAHYAMEFVALKALAARALQYALNGAAAIEDTEALAELRQLEQRLGPA